MANSDPQTSSTESGTPTESKAQEQARLRREKRNAKIQAQGSERLSKITSMSGRPVAAEAELEKSTSKSPNPPTYAEAAKAPVDDPDEVDISSLSQGPRGQSQEEILRQFLRGDGQPGSKDGPNAQQQQQGPEDPMMRMMQQMMGSMGGEQGAQGPDTTTQAFAEMFGAATSQQEPAFSNNDYIWRIIHGICAFALGFYALFTYKLVGSNFARSELLQDKSSPPLFWIFTSTQLVLQSSRYFIEGGRPPPSGFLAAAGRIVPDPYGNYLRILSRYRMIYNTIVTDALVIIFVLGGAAWWKGLAAS